MPIYSAKDVKYYKYITGFQQPILTENGTMGGDSFACYCPTVFGSYEPWKAFNEILNYEEVFAAVGISGSLYFYNPNPLRIKALTVYNRASGPYVRPVYTMTVYASNDNNDWILLTTYNNTKYKADEVWSVPVNSTEFYKYFRLDITTKETDIVINELKIVADCLNPETFSDNNSNWMQPFLSTDGTVGGDSYACRCNETYGSYYAHNAFDSDLSNQWVAPQSNDPTVWIEFYSPVLLKVSQLDITNVNNGYNTVWTRVEVFGSLDGKTYFSFGEYDTNTAQNATWTVNIPEEKQKLTKYIKITGAPGSSMSRNDRCRLAFVKIFAKEAFAIESTKDDYDYCVMPKIKQIVNPKYIKYYLFNAEPWTQPQIPDNGTFGGDRFAVAGAIPYTCYNGSDYTNGVNENSHFEFYNPEPIKVNKITITSSEAPYAQRAGYVSYSDDNVTWTKSNDWTNPSNNPYDIPVTEIFAHKYWQVYFTQRGTSGGNSDVNSVRIDAVTQNVQESNKNDYDYRKINQIREVYSGKNLVFSLGSKVIFEVGNLPDRSGQATYTLDIKRGVYELMCCSGGGGKYCYIGCNYGAAGSFFKGIVYFDHAQTLTIKVGSGSPVSSPNGQPTEIVGCIYCPGGRSANTGCPGNTAAPTLYDGMQVISTEINAGGVCSGESLFPNKEGGASVETGEQSGYVKLTYLRAFPKE